MTAAHPSSAKGMSAKEEAVAVAIRCRGGTVPSPKPSAIAKPAVPIQLGAHSTPENVSPGVAPPASVQGFEQFEGLGYTEAETETLAFLGRCGALPSISALGPMPSAAEFRAAIPEAVSGYTQEETATLAMLDRMGFGPNAKSTHPALPDEADGLTSEEAATLAMISRAGIGPFARSTTAPFGDSPQIPKGFRR